MLAPDTQMTVSMDKLHVNPRYHELRSFMDRYLGGDPTANQWVRGNYDEFRMMQFELRMLEGSVRELRQARRHADFLATIS